MLSPLGRLGLSHAECKKRGRALIVQSVLHVDDDIDIRNIVSLSLEAIGRYEVVSCASASEALIELQGFMPDVALLDLRMPGLSGEQLFEELKRRFGSRCFPVIFITAEALEETEKRLLGMGALAVISKPFDPMKLPRQVAAIVENCNRD